MSSPQTIIRNSKTMSQTEASSRAHELQSNAWKTNAVTFQPAFKAPLSIQCGHWEGLLSLEDTLGATAEKQYPLA